MDVQARIPSPLSGDGDMVYNWRMWREDFYVYLKVTGYDKQSKENRAYLLRNQIGPVGHKVIEKLMNEEQFNKNDIDVLLEKLDLHFNPRKTEIEERYNFFMTPRGQYETIERYVSNLTEMSKSCNFGDMTDSLIRDKVILSIVDVNLRKKCFEEDNLDLTKLMSIYKKHAKKKQVFNKRFNDIKGMTPTNFIGQNISGIENRRPCWRCKQTHPPRQCPAWGHKCNKCGQFNHLTICCRNSNMNTKEVEDKTTNKVQEKVNDPNVKEQECSKSTQNAQNNPTKRATVDASPLPSPTQYLYPSAPPLTEVEDLNPFSNHFLQDKSTFNKQSPDNHLSMIEILQKGERMNQANELQNRSRPSSPRTQATFVRGTRQNVSGILPGESKQKPTKSKEECRIS